MTELEDIAAEAQIAIVESTANEGCNALVNTKDTAAGCSGDSSGDTGDFPSIEELNALFSQRFTDDDPEYVKTVEMAEEWSKPPCVEDFFVRRSRDDNRRYRGGGGGRGSYHHGGSGDRDRHGHHHRDGNRYGNQSGWGGRGDYRDRHHSSDRDNRDNRHSRGRDRSPYR
ncbi:hypothetical protein ElyMa_004932200 [Elysia marginata]|uniref:RNA helicase n=1 Tax=Elysia marginata TaxID=1093978 RepID=A0AAV4IXY6_9GAST|nr:hypothetical protein ElyMa_004932200 [Elysia marginata]